MAVTDTSACLWDPFSPTGLSPLALILWYVSGLIIACCVMPCLVDVPGNLLFLMEDRGWGGTRKEARGRGKGKEQMPSGLAVIEERRKN